MTFGTSRARRTIAVESLFISFLGRINQQAADATGDSVARFGSCQRFGKLLPPNSTWLGPLHDGEAPIDVRLCNRTALGMSGHARALATQRRTPPVLR